MRSCLILALVPCSLLLLATSCTDKPATTCSVAENVDGSRTIICGESRIIVKDGAPGADGSSCHVTDNQDGTKTVACTDGTSVTVSDGAPGNAGSSCSVTDNQDGTQTIACADGTSVTVHDGAAGQAGTSCSVTDNQDGTKTIACTDGTSVTVSDGAAGSAGSACSVTDNQDGTSTIACTDGTSVTVSDGAVGSAGSSCSVTDNLNGTKTIACTDGTSVTVQDGAAGQPGTSCSVTDNQDGSNTITCTDGTSAVVSDGAAGQPGTSCSVTDNLNGTKTIACTDGTSVTVSDGVAGQPGTSCSVTDNQDGTNTIACTDGTSVTVSDGAAGQPGTSCSVTDNLNGTKTIACTDGTSVTVSDGATGPQGPQGPTGEPPRTAETCAMCHASGAIVDAVPRHQAIADDIQRTGRFEITGITFPAVAPLRPTVTFRLLDQQGNAAPGLEVLRILLVKKVLGTNGDTDSWVPYKFSAGNPTYERGRCSPATCPGYIGNAPAVGEGLLSDLGGGTYSYAYAFDFATAIGFDPTAVHRLAIQNDSALSPAGLGTFKANGYVDFIPVLGGSVSPQDPLADYSNVDTRAIVSRAACNSCHGLLTVHGRRYEPGLCVTCHNPSLRDDDHGNAVVDLMTLTHKLHMGALLPSVQAGGPAYAIGTWSFDGVVYPNRIANCTVCHQGAAQADRWKTRPTKEACSSCHDNIWFGDDTVTPAGMVDHTGFPQMDNSSCSMSSCHGTASLKSVENVHQDRVALEASNFAFYIDQPTSTAPGQSPAVIIQVYNPNTLTAYDLDAASGPWADPGATSQLNLRIAWNNLALTNLGSGSSTPGAPLAIDLLDPAQRTAVAAPAMAPDGFGAAYLVTAPQPLPPTASGSGVLGIDGHAGVTLPGDSAPTRIPVTNAARVFAITDAFPKAPNTVVDIGRCNSCHGSLSVHQDRNQGRTWLCSMCHNTEATDVATRPANPADSVDGLREQALDLKTLIHGLHASAATARTLTVYDAAQAPVTYAAVSYPNVLANCDACHASSSPTLPSTALPLGNAVRGTTVDTGADPADGTDNLRASKSVAACVGCHASGIATSHMQQMGGILGGVTQAELDSLQ